MNLNHNQINNLKYQYINPVEVCTQMTVEESDFNKKVLNSQANVSYGYSIYDRYPQKWDKTNTILDVNNSNKNNSFINKNQQQTAVITNEIPINKKVNPPLYPITLSSPNIATGYVNNKPIVEKKPIYNDYYYPSQQINLKNNDKKKYDYIETKIIKNEKQKNIQQLLASKLGINQPKQLQPNQLQPNQLQPNQLPPNQIQPNQLQSKQLQPKQLSPNQIQPNQIQPKQLPPNQIQPNQLQPKQDLSKQDLSNQLSPKQDLSNNASSKLKEVRQIINEIKNNQNTQNKRQWINGRDIYSLEPRYTNVYSPKRQYTYGYTFRPNTDDYFIDNTNSGGNSPIIMPDIIQNTNESRERVIAKTWKNEELDLARLKQNYEEELFDNVNNNSEKYIVLQNIIIISIIIIFYFYIFNKK